MLNKPDVSLVLELIITHLERVIDYYEAEKNEEKLEALQEIRRKLLLFYVQ